MHASLPSTGNGQVSVPFTLVNSFSKTVKGKTPVPEAPFGSGLWLEDIFCVPGPLLILSASSCAITLLQDSCIRQSLEHVLCS